MTTQTIEAGASTPTSHSTTPASPESAAGLTERLVTSMLGAFDVLSIYLGDQLGLYGPLADGWTTSTELADTTGTHERYTREWLEQQSAAGLVTVDEPGKPAHERRFHLPAAHAEVLHDTESLSYLTPFARVIAASAIQLPTLLQAYRTGDGVSWAQYGDHMRTGQGDANRALFLQCLATEWIPKIPGAADALRRGGRMADVGCGEGWSSIAAALGFPEAGVVGIDLDAESVEAAREFAGDYGVADRVSFHTADAAWIGDEGGFDLVTAFECVHDLANPVEVLASMRRMVSPTGSVVVMDEKVGEAFAGPADEVEQLMYGMSLMICLPDGMSHSPSAATGTVMRPAQLRDYAEQAGFCDVEVLDIDHDLFRFYLLRH